MKPVDTLTMLFSHHLWANLKLFEHCAQLTEEQLAASIPGSFGSIARTLQHIVNSEQSYFARISTGQPIQRPDGVKLLTMAEMLESLRRTGAGLIEWAPKVQAEDTVQVVDSEGTTVAIPKTILLTQAINHATEHREQIKAILTELGIEAPDLQGWAYFDELNA